MADTSNLTGSAITPISGMFNALMNMAWQDAQNSKARSFQRELLQRQIDAQASMYERYLSPKAVAKNLQEIGVNPAAYFGKGGSMASNGMPSVSSPNVAGTYGNNLPLENLGTSYAQSMAYLAEAKKNTSEGSAIDQKLDHEIELLIAEKQNKEANTAYTQMMTEIDKAHLPDKLKSEIKKNFKMASFYEVSGQKEQAMASYYRALKELTDNQNVVQAEFARNARDYVAKMITSLDAQSTANYAKAHRDEIEAETARQLRPIIKQLNQTQVKELQKRLPGIDLDNIEKVEHILDETVGTDKGLGAQVKVILGNSGVDDRKRIRKILLEQLKLANDSIK